MEHGASSFFFLHIAFAIWVFLYYFLKTGSMSPTQGLQCKASLVNEVQCNTEKSTFFPLKGNNFLLYLYCHPRIKYFPSTETRLYMLGKIIKSCHHIILNTLIFLMARPKFTRYSDLHIFLF